MYFADTSPNKICKVHFQVSSVTSTIVVCVTENLAFKFQFGISQSYEPSITVMVFFTFVCGLKPHFCGLFHL